MIYEGDVYRPPSEANSLIIQLTIGCARNTCTFCTMYKRKQFRVRKLEEVSKIEPKVDAPKKEGIIKTLTPELSAFQNAMREALGAKTVLSGNEKKGKITISYNSAEELEGIFQAVSKLLNL